MKSGIPVDVILYFELVRCSGPLVIGDPIYSITLLPGERVKLFTSDRHTKWSYDSESKLSYRHQTTSEESYFAAGMAEAISNLTINESGSSQSSYEDSWAEGGGGASFSFLGLIKVGGGGSGGSYDSESASSFSHSLSRHAESASRYVAASVRAKSTTSIGEVEQRQHAEGETEAHYESASRVFSNPNKCRAVTYLFHKINKVQNVHFKLVAVERRVADPKAPTGAYQRTPVDTTGRLSVKPEIISAASKERLEKEAIARTSASERQQLTTSAISLQQAGLLAAASYKTAQTVFERGYPTYDKDTRKAAIEAVDRELISDGILDEKTREPSDRFVKSLFWERKEILPTPGVIVKGCLDECATCEPSLIKEIKLDLKRKKLENDLLKRQIELLDKSNEYNCYEDEPTFDNEL
ncbi:MAG: hypothetical protein B6I20_00630 [Bacteroidetes bacterium 4572_117]|nr:MAG: hypothetical protein B6I20_00630 [Bacteroidetes bacterium 4572_117]